jgi:hypothetical protein
VAWSYDRARAIAGDEVAIPDVVRWRDGLIVYLKAYAPQRGRAARPRRLRRRAGADRAVNASSNLDLVRAIYADWKRGDFRSVCVGGSRAGVGDARQRRRGRAQRAASAAKRWREWLSAWDDYLGEADDYRALDDERVLVLGRVSGRGRISRVIGETETVNLFHIHEARSHG